MEKASINIHAENLRINSNYWEKNWSCNNFNEGYISKARTYAFKLEKIN